MEIYIYTLDCPITGIPKYIGKTVNVNRRFKQHIREYGETKKCRWIKHLKKNGLIPNITIVDTILSTDWEFWETWYIEYYRFLGFNLKNHKLGGIGGALSKETKDKISKKLKGKKKSESHRAKCILNLNKGIPWNKGIAIESNQKMKFFKGLNEYISKNGFPNAKINLETAIKIKRDLITKKLTHKNIAEKYGVTINIVSDINRGKTWKQI